MDEKREAELRALDDALAYRSRDEQDRHNLLDALDAERRANERGKSDLLAYRDALDAERRAHKALELTAKACLKTAEAERDAARAEAEDEKRCFLVEVQRHNETKREAARLRGAVEKAVAWVKQGSLHKSDPPFKALTQALAPGDGGGEVGCTECDEPPGTHLHMEPTYRKPAESEEEG